MQSRCGSVIIEADATAQSFADLLGALDLRGPVLVKPNWGTVECYTEADILDWTLAAIPGEKVVIESHGWARDEATLLGQPAGDLTRARLRQGDAWFRAYSGTDAVLAKHHVEYINLTEEIWAGRAADADVIRQVVEARYAPVLSPELYAKVPARLYDLRGGTLLSLAKYKLVFEPLCVSFAIKNLFGLIPGPSRGKYHGPQHQVLDQNIVDINKIYRSLFTVQGVIEVVHSAGVIETEQDRTRAYPGTGQAFASPDLLALDAFAATTAGRDPASVGHLRLAAETFGPWDEITCAEAQASGIHVLAA